MQPATRAFPALGRRICVYGYGGKTATAKLVGEILRLPVIELDAIFWQPNWVETPRPEFREKVFAAIAAAPDVWVIDGNYSYLRAELLRQADTVIWLDLPYRVAMWRLFKRTVARAWDKRRVCGENRESWRLSFLSRDSVLLEAATRYPSAEKRVRRHLAEINDAATLIEFRSAREHGDFIDWLADAYGV